MKNFEQTRDVLDQVRDFHRQVSELYHRLADEAGKERIKMLLDYMSRHEQNMEESLKEYEDEASEMILNTWFQFVPDDSILKSVQDIQLQPDMSVEDVISLALRLDDILIDLYKRMVEEAEIPEVQEVFQNLLEMENQEKHLSVRNSLSVDDI